ncbi:type II glyceraldehyde-3-phosphate dehydrogenase [Halalkalirubrum salinum]|uniref:type II glyceraldehyde-3-phosphate dehydrogenase n=1 Tax=Halalkalirubrum salinum TaxID=2563889 RepID=UPI0010FB167D|nr:type II glyceraldehyde-3-phosphate dehydrogenase [Halalkalirubrum salinum]
MIRVGVNGYGTIGKRVADAIGAQPDMTLTGVAKTQPNYEAEAAVRKGYPLYAAIPERSDRFAEAGIDLAGEVEDLIIASDVIVDATPSGIGEANCELYRQYETPAILQGGEDADAVDASFVARANYDDAIDADVVRVVSCNTTGLSRLLAPLQETYGVEKARVTLIRRGGDPGQVDRGPINDILPDPITVPSHHGPDVNTIYPDVNIDTLGVKVPATLMHLHSVNITLESEPSAAEVRELLSAESRLFLVPQEAGIDGTGKLKEFAMDTGRPRGDLWENCIWADSISTDGRDLYLFQSIHQEADVVPENIDAIRAITDRESQADSMAITDDRLGVGLESLFEGIRQRVVPHSADD